MATRVPKGNEERVSALRELLNGSEWGLEPDNPGEKRYKLISTDLSLRKGLGRIIGDLKSRGISYYVDTVYFSLPVDIEVPIRAGTGEGVGRFFIKKGIIYGRIKAHPLSTVRTIYTCLLLGFDEGYMTIKMATEVAEIFGMNIIAGYLDDKVY